MAFELCPYLKEMTLPGSLPTSEKRIGFAIPAKIKVKPDLNSQKRPCKFKGEILPEA